MGQQWIRPDHSPQGRSQSGSNRGWIHARLCAGWSRRGTGQRLPRPASFRLSPTARTRRRAPCESSTPVVMAIRGSPAAFLKSAAIVRRRRVRATRSHSAGSVLGYFRGDALCGAPLLERLLRRLLSELLGFLRALHLHPPWALSLTPVTRSLGGRQLLYSMDRRRPRRANAHTEYRTALRRMICRDHHRDRVRDRRNPREHPHLTCLAALVSLSSTRSTNGHPG